MWFYLSSIWSYISFIRTQTFYCIFPLLLAVVLTCPRFLGACRSCLITDFKIKTSIMLDDHSYTLLIPHRDKLLTTPINKSTIQIRHWLSLRVLKKKARQWVGVKVTLITRDVMNTKVLVKCWEILRKYEKQREEKHEWSTWENLHIFSFFSDFSRNIWLRI